MQSFFVIYRKAKQNETYDTMVLTAEHKFRAEELVEKLNKKPDGDSYYYVEQPLPV